MSDRTAIAYSYDGSFDGLLCCVFESYDRREIPADIRSEDALQPTLFPARFIPTDPEKAERVAVSIPKKMSAAGMELISTGFLFCGEGKEMAILRFLRLGFRYGASVLDMMGNADVCRLQHIVRAVRNEAHLSLEFLRFSEYNGGLVAIIDPKHLVLPLMQSHFCSRFPEERFIIFDKTHGMALLYQPYEAEIIAVDELDLPQKTEAELSFEQLWKQYYDSIAIQERINPRCRMTHMPKHFWPRMTELNGDPGRLAHSVGKSLKRPAGRNEDPPKLLPDTAKF